MNANAHNASASAATSRVQPHPRTEADLLAYEATLAKSALRRVWRETVREARQYPADLANRRPWSVVLAVATTGVLVGASGESKDRGDNQVPGEKSRAHERAPGRSQRSDHARHAAERASVSAIRATLRYAGPAFALGFLAPDVSEPQEKPETEPSSAG